MCLKKIHLKVVLNKTSGIMGGTSYGGVGSLLLFCGLMLRLCLCPGKPGRSDQPSPGPAG